MNYKIFFIIILLYSCTPIDKSVKIDFKENFKNRGFTITFTDNLYNQKIISKKLDNRSMTVFQRNLKVNTNVKITNILNNKSIIAVVGNKAKYPNFYNSVITKRIADMLEISEDEPYISIIVIDENSTFVAGKSKTFDEERSVAEKAPVVEIGIKDLSEKNSVTVSINEPKKEFKYVIKIADFYYLESAKMLKKRLIKEYGIKNPKIAEITKTNYRLYLGPYDNLMSIKKAHNKIEQLNFENIEIIKL